MLQKTSGIVISQVKYSESSLIVKIYTEAFGLKSYIVNSVRAKSSKTKSAYFRPLTLLDMVVYNKASSSIQRISELKSLYTFTSLPYEKNKILIGLFMAEVLSKTLKEEQSDSDLFQFISSSLILVDKMQNDYANFPLTFLFRFSAHLGFYISLPGLQLSPEEEIILNELSTANGNSLTGINNNIRRRLTQLMINFYSSHLDNFKNLNSLEIIQQLL